MAWLHAYHGLMRAALALKRRGARPADEAGLAAIAADCQVTIDSAFAARVAAPPHGRLMVVVFDRLSELFAIPPKVLWDTLFPPRKGERAYRQR
jgi:hypothetical protein